jgi:hypothetical protein
MNRKPVDVSTRLSPDELAKRSMAARVEAANKAMQGEKVRYKSPGDPREVSKVPGASSHHLGRTQG